jgi:streptomycin 6-kinase
MESMGKKPRRRRSFTPEFKAEIVELVCERWELTLSGRAPRGDWSTILVASRRGVPCVLKIAGPEHNAIDEALALEAWNGNGAVRLLEADREHGALLLERLDPDRTLRTGPWAGWGSAGTARSPRAQAEVSSANAGPCW